MKNTVFIAEVKTTSPFGWRSDKSWEELFEIANRYGDWLSIHTDPRWGGSFELIAKARKLTNKPILAKGIHKTDKEIVQAIEAGADYVLVVGRLPKIHLGKCLIEVNSIDQFSIVPTGTRAVWNQRDLANGKPKADSFNAARKAWNGWLAQASYINTPSDISKGADAYIVGTNLTEFIASP